MNRPLVAVVMAGGTGTRLYPAARPDRPKQFLALGGDRSLLERTVDRVAFADETLVVTREAHESGVRERAPDATVLVEPEPKDTGPALVYAAHRARELYDDPVLLCVPADHVVTDRDGPGGSFAGVGRAAARVAADAGALVTVGVEPTRPATGYGYVEPGPWRELEWPGGQKGEAGSNHPDDAPNGRPDDAPNGRPDDAPNGRPEGAPERYAPVASFHEKPDAATAAEYVAAGHRWNTGVFAWTPGALLSAAADSPLAPLVDHLDDGDPEGGYAAVEAASVDYAVMERAADAAVVPGRFDWDDLGTWDAVRRALASEGALARTGDVRDGAESARDGAEKASGGAEAETAGDGAGSARDGAEQVGDGTKVTAERPETATDEPELATDEPEPATDEPEPATDEAVTLGEALALDAPGSLVATDGPHVAVAGVADVVVAAFDDRVVVVPRAEAERVRDVVAALREEGRF